MTCGFLTQPEARPTWCPLIGLAQSPEVRYTQVWEATSQPISMVLRRNSTESPQEMLRAEHAGKSEALFEHIKPALRRT